MPTEMLTTDEHRESPAAPGEVSTNQPEHRTPERHYLRRVRRMRINVAAWALGTIVLTALWAVLEWQANGAFERFAHEGNPGDWNPTLLAVIVGLWGLAVGIMALRVRFERPPQIRRLRFHIAAWVLGMLVLTPLNALIEWQDNGGFERLSSNSQPGSWDPWVLTIGGIWALAIAVLAVWEYAGGRRGWLGTRS